MTLKWKFIFFTALFTATIFTEATGRVLLRDITSLTLYRGEYTEGRRSSPVPQLECTGGTASGKFSPKVVQCYNRGWDGKDVQWECQAEMPADYQFGRIDVSCEGYDYPNDPYILAGSCGLRYELDYSAAGASKTAFPSTYPKDSWLTFEKIISILVILFIVYLVYSMLSGNEGTGRTAAGGGGGGSWPGNPPDDGRRPPPPGWNPPTAPPPSYDDACGGSGPKASSSNQQQRTADSGPGFYSGLGLGALGGYFFGRGTGTGSGYGDSGYRYRNNRRHYGGDGGSSSSYFDSGSSSYTAGPSTSSASSSTHTSTGYGGTSRR